MKPACPFGMHCAAMVLSSGVFASLPASTPYRSRLWASQA
jgi:hypothetical protein